MLSGAIICGNYSIGKIFRWVGEFRSIDNFRSVDLFRPIVLNCTEDNFGLSTDPYFRFENAIFCPDNNTDHNPSILNQIRISNNDPRNIDYSYYYATEEQRDDYAAEYYG